MSGM
ncbi:hypothetical protein CCH79_00014660 [Gambusia affinis]